VTRGSQPYLGRPVRLVYLDDPTRRPVDPEFGRDGDVVSFADGYPLLLTSSASLDELGRWLIEDGEQPVPMTRFRPSAVVTGAPAWAEDRWRRIRVGAVEFRVVKPCGRCVVTTTDQITGEVGSQPLKMLGQPVDAVVAVDEAADARLAGRYAVRSGVEGTVNEFAHGHGMRRCRYRGQPKAHLQHVFTHGHRREHKAPQRSAADRRSTPSRPPTAFQDFLDQPGIPRMKSWRAVSNDAVLIAARPRPCSPGEERGHGRGNSSGRLVVASTTP
jgi:hypothetical protein